MRPQVGERRGVSAGATPYGSAALTAQLEGVRALTSTLRAKNFALVDNNDTATVITGAARFVDPHTIAVGTGQDGVTVTAPTILVNTGSEPVIPDIPGLANDSHLVSSTDLTQITHLPERLVIIGGGYLGLELASIRCS